MTPKHFFERLAHFRAALDPTAPSSKPAHSGFRPGPRASSRLRPRRSIRLGAAVIGSALLLATAGAQAAVLKFDLEGSSVSGDTVELTFTIDQGATGTFSPVAGVIDNHVFDPSVLTDFAIVERDSGGNILTEVGIGPDTSAVTIRQSLRNLNLGVRGEQLLDLAAGALAGRWQRRRAGRISQRPAQRRVVRQLLRTGRSHRRRAVHRSRDPVGERDERSFGGQLLDRRHQLDDDRELQLHVAFGDGRHADDGRSRGRASAGGRLGASGRSRRAPRPAASASPGHRLTGPGPATAHAHPETQRAAPQGGAFFGGLGRGRSGGHRLGGAETAIEALALLGHLPQERGALETFAELCLQLVTARRGVFRSEDVEP